MRKAYRQTRPRGLTFALCLLPFAFFYGLVAAGVLVQTAAGYAWRESRKTFLFPVVKPARDFRDAFCAGLLRLYRWGELRLVGACAGLEVEGLVAAMQAKAREVYWLLAAGR